jgi:hypothetical protein
VEVEKRGDVKDGDSRKRDLRRENGNLEVPPGGVQDVFLKMRLWGLRKADMEMS